VGFRFVDDEDVGLTDRLVGSTDEAGAATSTVVRGSRSPVQVTEYREFAASSAKAAVAACELMMRQSVSLTASYQRKPMMSGCFGRYCAKSWIHLAFRPAASVAAVSVMMSGFLLKVRNSAMVALKIVSGDR
jgi:hypothetical protein